MKVLVVDDEPLGREALRQALADIEDAELVGECGDVASAVASIHALAPDLVLLDIHLPMGVMDKQAAPGEAGFAVLSELAPQARPAVVFVTAHPQHALRAFDVEAVDYLVKPVTRAGLERACRRARRWLGERAAGGSRAEARAWLERIACRVAGQTHLIPVGDVHWIEAAGSYVRIHTGARIFLLRAALGALAERLDPERFVRIHRSTLVNVDRVLSITALEHGDQELVVEGGQRLRLSRRRRAEVARRLGLPE